MSLAGYLKEERQSFLWFINSAALNSQHFRSWKAGKETKSKRKKMAQSEIMTKGYISWMKISYIISFLFAPVFVCELVLHTHTHTEIYENI